MESSESRHAPSPEPASDDSASPCNHQPPLDRLDFDPVPLRRRVDGLTPEKQRLYVEALADTGIAREAASRVGLSEQAINRVRRRADARSFDNACEAAHLFGARRLRSIAYERAVEGTLKGHYYHGERVGEERVYDHRLLIYLLGKTEHLLRREERRSQAICEDWEAHMDALEQGLEPPGPRRAEAAHPETTEWTGHECRKDDEGIWWTSFPPPAGFDGLEQGAFGEDYYQRTLSHREQAVLDSELDEDLAEYRAGESARRDRFFGFAGDAISSPGEAETNETSEPSDPDPRPIEYKSAFPPAAGKFLPRISGGGGPREARWRGSSALKGPLHQAAPKAQFILSDAAGGVEGPGPPPRQRPGRNEEPQTFPPPRAFPR